MCRSERGSRSCPLGRCADIREYIHFVVCFMRDSAISQLSVALGLEAAAASCRDGRGALHLRRTATHAGDSLTDYFSFSLVLSLSLSDEQLEAPPLPPLTVVVRGQSIWLDGVRSTDPTDTPNPRARPRHRSLPL